MIVLYNHKDPAMKAVASHLFRLNLQESRYRDKYDYSEMKMLQLLAKPDVFMAFAVIRGVYAGFFLGMVQTMWFSAKTRYGCDLSLYIVPEHRGGIHAVRLIRAFEKFCKERGCVEVTLSSSAEISTELAERLYTKLGYRKCGFMARKAIAPAEGLCKET